MPVAYNPVTDSFSTFENVETPKVELNTNNYPLMDELPDISTWSRGVSEKGTPIVDGPTLPQAQEKSNDDLPRMPEIPKVEQSQTFNSKISDRRKQAFDFFKRNGFSDIHAAGIVGSLTGESGKQLNPTAKNPTSGAFGIAQWLGGRQRALFAKYGKNPSFEQQLEFILEELNGPENKALNHLLSTTSIADATRSFTSMFERPSKKEIENSIKSRITNGEELLR